MGLGLVQKVTRANDTSTRTSLLTRRIADNIAKLPELPLKARSRDPMRCPSGFTVNTASRTVGVARLGEVGRPAGRACGLGRARSDLILCSSSRDELGAQRRADFFQQQLEQAVFVRI